MPPTLLHSGGIVRVAYKSLTDKTLGCYTRKRCTALLVLAALPGSSRQSIQTGASIYLAMDNDYLESVGKPKP